MKSDRYLLKVVAPAGVNYFFCNESGVHTVNHNFYVVYRRIYPEKLADNRFIQPLRGGW